MDKTKRQQTATKYCGVDEEMAAQTMISDFPWTHKYDEAGGTYYYYNVVTNARADTFESILLPPDWYFDASDKSYYNDTLEERTAFLPGQLFENDKLTGYTYPYKSGTTDEDGKMIYRRRLTQAYVEESAIVLPDGWNRGVTPMLVNSTIIMKSTGIQLSSSRKN